ncbi:MAG: response regulator, partial [Cyclobacteriaceae bacterium]|nr:response regulator [Cyclobacteriaceae bacterium]
CSSTLEKTKFILKPKSISNYFIHIVKNFSDLGKVINFFTQLLKTSVPIKTIQPAYSGIRNGRKVLIIDEDVKNIFTLTKTLEGIKFKVIPTIKKEEVIDALEETPDIDLVLIENSILNNLDSNFISSLKEFRKKYKIPCIVMISDHSEYQEFNYPNGLYFYIRKPIDSIQLEKFIQILID